MKYNMLTLDVNQGKEGLIDKLFRFLSKRKRVLVNEHKCPSCGKWSHELPLPPTWKTIANVYHKTCYCGYQTKWIDTGFMGVMAQIDSPESESSAFYHVIK